MKLRVDLTLVIGLIIWDSLVYTAEIIDCKECSQDCDRSHASPICLCFHGYELAVDKRTCIDKDECSEDNGGCLLACVNHRGGFKCQPTVRCRLGYSQSQDGKCLKDASEGESTITVAPATKTKATTTTVATTTETITAAKPVTSETTEKSGSCPRYGVWGMTSCLTDTDCPGLKKCCQTSSYINRGLVCSYAI